jgi:hypothetical protein
MLVLFQLGCYKFKICIVTPKITINKITKRYTGKERKREPKWCTTKTQLKGLGMQFSNRALA